MGNPSSAGMGQGAAQVFDTRGVLNTFVRVSMMEQQQRQLDEQNLAKMMTQFDPSKIRANDLPEFNEKYNRLQNLYMQNKGLYKHPMKYPDKYREATQLINELRVMPADSKNVEEKAAMLSKGLLDKPDMFDDRSMEEINFIANNSTSAIKQRYNGRIPEISDFHYVPKAPDEKFRKAYLHDSAETSGMAIQEEPIITPINEWSNSIVQRRVVGKDIVGPAAMGWLAKKDNRKWYTHQWEELSPEEKGAITVEMSKKGLSGIDITNGPALLAASDMLASDMVISQKESNARNEDAFIAQRKKEAIEASNRSLSNGMKLRRYGFDLAQQAQKDEIDRLVDIDNMNIKHGNQFMGTLAYADQKPETANDAVDLAIAPLKQYSAKMPGGITKAIPSKTSKQDYIDRVMKVQNTPGAVKNYDTYTTNEAELGSAYDKGYATVAFIMESKNDDGTITKTPYVISPNRMDVSALQPIVNTLGNKTRGFGQSYPGYTQTKKKVKK